MIMLFFYIRLPFNWKTPLGYLIALLALALAAYFTLVCATSNLCLLGGSCRLFISFIDDISQDLSVLNKFKSENRCGKDVLKCYCNIIQTYEDVKQLSAYFDSCFSSEPSYYLVVLWFLGLSMTSMCSANILSSFLFCGLYHRLAAPFWFYSQNQFSTWHIIEILLIY